jgi:hypothetical protein
MHDFHYSLEIVLYVAFPIGNIHMLMKQVAILATQVLHFLSSNGIDSKNLNVPILCATKRLLQDFQPSLALHWKHELSTCKGLRFDL